MLLNREIRFGFRVFFLRYKLQSLVHWDSWAPPGEFRRELALLQILLSSCTEWRICYPFTSLFWHFYALSEPLLWLYSISTSTYWTIRNPFIRDILCALSSWSRFMPWCHSWLSFCPRALYILTLSVKCECFWFFRITSLTWDVLTRVTILSSHWLLGIDDEHNFNLWFQQMQTSWLRLCNLFFLFLFQLRSMGDI
jgi:hypothetical protein